MWKQCIKSGILVTGLVTLGAMPATAQNVEAIMSARERLELSEQQIQQLDAIRREAVAQRSADQARIAELRSQLAAGQIRRSELMAAMEDQQDARQARAEQRRASIDAILTDAQRESVEQMRRRADRQRPEAGRVGPRGGRGAPGPGARPRPGFRPGADVGPEVGSDVGPGPRVGLR